MTRYMFTYTITSNIITYISNFQIYVWNGKSQEKKTSYLNVMSNGKSPEVLKIKIKYGNNDLKW